MKTRQTHCNLCISIVIIHVTKDRAGSVLDKIVYSLKHITISRLEVERSLQTRRVENKQIALGPPPQQ